MRLQVNPQSSIPLYVQIVEQIRNQILSGILPSNSSLPSVREISEMIEVNSLTIQKALKILETEKFVIIRRGVGSFVSDNISAMNIIQKENIIRDSLVSIISHAQELGLKEQRFIDLASELWGQRA